jgi:hypothetical protein
MTHLVAAVIVLLSVACAEAFEPYRLSGRVDSIVPTRGVVFLADTDHERPDVLVPVMFRDARVVRISRRPRQPWEWQTRGTRLHRWPAGTFVVVSGRRDASGVVWADRIEIPKPDGR